MNIKQQLERVVVEMERLLRESNATNTRMRMVTLRNTISAIVEQMPSESAEPDGVVSVPVEYARVAGKILSGEMSFMVNDKTTKIGRALIAAAKEGG